jgi:hypothetical protein
VKGRRTAEAQRFYNGGTHAKAALAVRSERISQMPWKKDFGPVEDG